MLTNTQIKTLKSKDKLFREKDYDGLYIEVPVKGKLRWRFRYRFNNKAIQKSLGTYPEISLKEARDLRDTARADVAKGIDPFPSKIVEEEKVEKTYKEWSEFYLDKIVDDVTETHQNRILKGFKADVYPYIGSMPMNNISAKHIIQIVNIMAERGAKESAKKVFSSISRCFQVCMANFPDEIERNPCKDIALKDLLGKRREVHYPIITDSKELGILLNAINEYSGHTSTKMALLMIAHTFVRPHNIRHAKWEQINLETAQWIIPAKEMKSRKELIVPLSTHVIAILKDMQRLSNPDSYVFPSPKSKTETLSDAALVGALRRLGYTKEQIVAHSFRGIFSTLTHEKGKFDHAVIETQLAHTVGSSVSQAYNRAVYLKERTQMMQWYSDLLEGYQNVN
jgi:integrase